MPEQATSQAESSAEAARGRTSPAYYAPFESSHDFAPQAPSLPLAHYIWLFRRYLWKMVAFVAACVLLTFVISARLRPVYESTATINIDLQAPSAVVGQGSTVQSNSVDNDIFFTTQIRLVQSDAVLRPVVEQYHLLDNQGGMSVDDLQKTQSLSSAPVFLNHLNVTRPINTYLLQISYRASSPALAANVANAIANSYLAQTNNLRTRSSADLSTFMGQQLDELRSKMERSGQTLAKFERDMDVINPEQKTDILSARLQQLNSEYTTAQADRAAKEAAWNSVKAGSVQVAGLSQHSDSLEKLADTLNDAREHFALVEATYGVNHPEYRKASAQLAEAKSQFNSARQLVSDRIQLEYQEALNREQILLQAVTDLKQQWDEVNANSVEYQQLKQEADADQTLYHELVTKINEAGINSDFQSNNIRLADLARPSTKPVSPNIKINVLVALLFSIILACCAAVLYDSLDTTLRDANEARRYLGTDVIGSLPLDKDVPELVPASKPVDPAAEAAAAAVSSEESGKGRKGYYRSVSLFEEAVRTIRNTILLSDFEQRLRSIAITSAEPSEGKTTLSVHLAIANAARGKTTLLVDGDLRRPSVHAKFGLNPRVGLSNVLNGEMSWESALLPIDGRPNLSLLPSGPGSHRAADLIGPHLSLLLDEFAKKFDLVILDSPPLLGFAECLQMANAADGVLVVSKAGSTKRKSVAAVVSTLKRVRANLLGVVLNQVTQNTSEDGYHYYAYEKYRHPSEQE